MQLGVGIVKGRNIPTPGPSFTVGPTISGPGNEVGVTLTASATAVGSGGISYAYQWYRDSVAIGGATASTYVVATAGTHFCVVAATDSNGTRSSGSNSILIITASPVWTWNDGTPIDWNDSSTLDLN